MTSLQKIKRKNGAAWRIQYVIGGQRRTLYLGVHYTRAHAVEIDVIVKKIVDAMIAGVELDASTRAWLDRISDDLRERLERAGLLAPRKNPRVADVFRRYSREVLPSLSAATQRLRAYFFKLFLEAGGDVLAADLTSETIDAIKRRLDERFAQASRANALITARTAFNWAVDIGILENNPLRGVAAGSKKNKAREYFITREVASVILDKFEKQSFRTLFVLYRWGGLRLGEAFALRWRDVDFAEGRLHVPSPKTARAGKPERVIPLFSPIRRELERERRQGDAAPDDCIIPHSEKKRFRVALTRAVVDCGLEVWPRLIQNLRASRANEVYRRRGAVVEAAWIGHTEQTAREHYLAVTDEDFRDALAEDF